MKKGWISAENLWEVLSNVKHDKDLDFDTTAVNEFVLVSNKTEFRGKLTRTDFINGVLRGFYEKFTLREAKQ